MLPWQLACRSVAEHMRSASLVDQQIYSSMRKRLQKQRLLHMGTIRCHELVSQHLFETFKLTPSL
jgi:hypothetical protein